MLGTYKHSLCGGNRFSGRKLFSLWKHLFSDLLPFCLLQLRASSRVGKGRKKSNHQIGFLQQLRAEAGKDSKCSDLEEVYLWFQPACEFSEDRDLDSFVFPPARIRVYFTLGKCATVLSGCWWSPRRWLQLPGLSSALPPTWTLSWLWTTAAAAPTPGKECLSHPLGFWTSSPTNKAYQGCVLA